MTFKKTAGPSASLFADTIPFSPTLAKEFGICEALILQQVEYWCSKKLNFRRNHYWVYKTYEDWVEELKCFSISSVRRAIKNLKDRKILVVSTDLNKFGYDKTLWYRIDKVEYEKAVAIMCSIWTHGGVQSDHMDKVKMTTPIPETTTETTPETTVADKYAKEKNMDVNSTLLEIGKKIPGTPSALWKKRMNTLYGKFQKELTVQENSQLKMACKKIGADHMLVLDYALQNWFEFSHVAKSSKGAGTHEIPTVGYFLKYYDCAVVAYQQSLSKAKPKVTEVCNQLHSPSQACENPKVLKHEVYVPTDEELAETMAMFTPKD